MKSRSQIKLIPWVAFVCLTLVPGLSLGSSYRDKHGNDGTITLGSPMNLGGGGIDYTVPYSLTDSAGSASGEYVITSEMLPGRDPNSDDFVLNVFVSDLTSQNAAELVLRNNPNVAPLAPILRLLDCSSSPCTEVTRYDDEKWGCWIIRGHPQKPVDLQDIEAATAAAQSDIANYPIELLDTRVIIQLLEPARLALLPNSDDGTGNWAEIMENHRTNFKEAKFRADIDVLGVPQSDLLTKRMIDAVVPNDFLAKHFPAPPAGIGIRHGALTFLTGHQGLIEEMTDVLFTNHLNDWRLNCPGPQCTEFAFPFGRMPAYLVDPFENANGGNIHILPDHWERVQPGEDALLIHPSTEPGGAGEGCHHDFPSAGNVPTAGADNLGQSVCRQFTTHGFMDRPCTDPGDYVGAVAIPEGGWHGGVHGFIGGSFGPIDKTSGTAIFYAFHTYASTVVLSNWRHAQKRDIGIPNRTPVCDANGAYVAECEGSTTDVLLDGAGSSDPDGDPLTYEWATDCPGGTFDDATSATSTLTVDSVAPCPLDCTVTLTVTDDIGASAECDAEVTIEDTTAPEVTADPDNELCLWPPNHKYVFIDEITAMAQVEDNCDENPQVVEVVCESNQCDDAPCPEHAGQNGDGKTVDDCVYDPAMDRLAVRSERAGTDPEGRTYLVTLTAADACGNVSDPVEVLRVRVPHDQNPRMECISSNPKGGKNTKGGKNK